jgi:hypothetical protein
MKGNLIPTTTVTSFGFNPRAHIHSFASHPSFNLLNIRTVAHSFLEEGAFLGPAGQSAVAEGDPALSVLNESGEKNKEPKVVLGLNWFTELAETAH